MLQNAEKCWRAGKQRLAGDRRPSHQLEMSFEHVVWPLLQLVQAPGQCLRIMVVDAEASKRRQQSTKNAKSQQSVVRCSCTFVGINKI